MKQKKYAILSIFLLAISVEFGFGQITEGHFQYTIKTTATDTNLETRQKVGMMQNARMDVFFTDVKSRIDFNIGSMFYSCIVVDNSIPRALSLNKSPQGAYAAYLGKDVLSMDRQTDTSAHAELVNETKTILGFECKKAILYQNNEVTVYWYTDKIQIDKRGNPLLNQNIPGFPMAFVKVTDGMKIEYLVSFYEASLEHKDVLFSLMIPEGYKLVNN